MHELAYNISAASMRHEAGESVGMAAMNQPAIIICLLPSPLTAELSNPFCQRQKFNPLLLNPLSSYCKLKLHSHHDIFLYIMTSRRAARPFLSDHHNPNVDGFFNFNFNAPVLISISSKCLRYHHHDCCCCF